MTVPKTKIENLCLINPDTLKKKNPNVLIHYVNGADIPKNSFYFRPRKIIKIKDIQNIKNRGLAFKKNDILVPRYFDGLKHKKIVKIKSMKKEIGGITDHFIVLRANENVSSDWLFFFLKSPQFKKTAEQAIYGALIKRIPTKFLRLYKIPIFSLKIQKQIISKTKKEMDKIQNIKKLLRKLKKKNQKEIETMILSQMIL